MSVPVLNEKGAVLIEDQNIEVTRGKVNGVGYVRKFGKNPTPANGVWETLWDGSTAGDYPFPSVHSGVVVTSDSDFDEPLDGAGTLAGAQAVHIYGLASGTWALQDEIVPMSGTSVNNYARIFRAYVTTVGVSGANVGNISCKIDGTEIAKIGANNGQTLMAVYTIPSGTTGIMPSAHIGVFADAQSNTKIAEFELISRKQGESRRIRANSGLKDTTLRAFYTFPPVFEEMTDIWIMVKAGVASVIATGGFDIRIEDNE